MADLTGAVQRSSAFCALLEGVSTLCVGNLENDMGTWINFIHVCRRFAYLAGQMV